MSSNIWTVRELGVCGSQVLVTLLCELREGGCCFVMCVCFENCVGVLVIPVVLIGP